MHSHTRSFPTFIVTIFKVAVPQVDVTAWASNDALNLCMSGLVFDTNDRASLQYSSMQSLNIETIEISLLQRQSSGNDKPKFYRLAGASLGLALDTFKAPLGWQEQAIAQQSFMRQQDAFTRRAVPAYSTEPHDDGSYHVGPLFLPRPFPPEDDDSSSSTEGWESDFSMASETESTATDEPMT